MQTRTRTVYCDDDILIVYKPSKIPSAPLTDNGDEFCLLNIVRKDFPEVIRVKGKIEREGGLIHRLDTPTKGLVMFARTQEAYDSLSAQQKADGIIKEYRARITKGRDPEVPAFPEYPHHNVLIQCGFISSYFRSYGEKGASVRPALSANAKRCSGVLYTTETRPLDEESVMCTITRGFRHQIRCHLAWAGYPIAGDTRYGGVETDDFGLEAVSLSFLSPSSGARLTITL